MLVFIDASRKAGDVNYNDVTRQVVVILEMGRAVYGSIALFLRVLWFLMYSKKFRAEVGVRVI